MRQCLHWDRGHALGGYHLCSHEPPESSRSCKRRTFCLSMRALDKRLDKAGLVARVDKYGAFDDVGKCLSLERRYGTRLAPQVTGNTFPGATLPHGMAQLSPVLDPPKWPWRDRWRYNSGYHRVPSQHAARFLGVGHTALSGTGLNAGGDFLLSPCDGVGHLMHSAEYGEPGSYGGTILCPGGFPYRLDVAAALRGGILRISFGAVSPRRIVASLRSPLDALNRGHVWGDPDISGALFGMRSSNKTHHCGSARSASLARVE